MAFLYHFRRLVTICMVSMIVWVSCGTDSAQALTLEEQVLQIIRDNPEVLIESVQAYQLRQQAEQQLAQQAVLQKLKTQPASIIGNSPVRGAKAQTIVLVEFSDFQCPFCAEAYDVVEDFVDKHQDEVTFVYKNFPLTQIHPQAQSAALAAWAAQQQGEYWPYYRALFENQNSLGEGLYLAIAEDLGLDVERFNYDRSGSRALAAINEDVELALDLVVPGTPTLFMNGVPISLPLTVSSLENVLDQVKAS